MNVALTTLWGVPDPIILAVAFLIPKTSRIDLIVLLAFIPTPFLALLMTTFVALYFPIMVCGKVWGGDGMVIVVWLAWHIALTTASWASIVLADPNPTDPQISPKMTNA